MTNWPKAIEILEAKIEALENVKKRSLREAADLALASADYKMEAADCAEEIMHLKEAVRALGK